MPGCEDSGGHDPVHADVILFAWTTGAMGALQDETGKTANSGFAGGKSE